MTRLNIRLKHKKKKKKPEKKPRFSGMIDVVRDRGDQATGLVQLVQEPLDPVFFQEYGGGLQHVGRVRGIVVSVFGVVVAFDHGQPRVQRPFVAAQGLVHLEVRQQVHAQVHQRPVEQHERTTRVYKAGQVNYYFFLFNLSGLNFFQAR